MHRLRKSRKVLRRFSFIGESGKFLLSFIIMSRQSRKAFFSKVWGENRKAKLFSHFQFRTERENQEFFFHLQLKLNLREKVHLLHHWLKILRVKVFVEFVLASCLAEIINSKFWYFHRKLINHGVEDWDYSLQKYAAVVQKNVRKFCRDFW